MKKSDYFILSLLICVEVFCRITSFALPAQKQNFFTPHCETVKSLVNSNYTKSCVTKSRIECVALDDLAAKWCLKSTQEFELPDIEDVSVFDSYIAKYESSQTGSFCAFKNVTPTEDKMDLLNFYTDPLYCSSVCLDPATDNKKDKKVCIALAWLQTTIVQSKKPPQPQSVKAESKPAVITKPSEKHSNSQGVANQKHDANSEKEKGPDAKQISIKNEPKLEGKTVDKTPVVPKSEPAQQKEKPSTNKEQPQENVKPILEIDKKVDQAENKNEEKPVDDTPQLSPKNTHANKVIQNTKVNSQIKQNTEEIKTDKKIELNSEKAGISEKTEKKLTTLSENTNEDINAPDDKSVQQTLEKGDQSNMGESQEMGNTEGQKISRFVGKKAEEESHLFSYFVAFSLLFVCCYIGYLNKKKIFAILLEGRRSRSGRGRRRPSTANYRKLDCNLEEAVTSQCNSNVTNVIY